LLSQLVDVHFDAKSAGIPSQRFDKINGNGYTSLVVSRSRPILALPIIVWLAVAGHVDAREFKAIVFKKGSPDLGERIPQEQLKQFITNVSVPDYRGNEVLRKLTGVGVFDLRINPATGETTGIRILKSTGHSELDASALKALINWRFKPGTLIRAIFPFMFAHFRDDWPITPGAFSDRDYMLRPPR
jgi:TonB family protein